MILKIVFVFFLSILLTTWIVWMLRDMSTFVRNCKRRHKATSVILDKVWLFTKDERDWEDCIDLSLALTKLCSADSLMELVDGLDNGDTSIHGAKAFLALCELLDNSSGGSRWLFKLNPAGQRVYNAVKRRADMLVAQAATGGA